MCDEISTADYKTWVDGMEMRCWYHRILLLGEGAALTVISAWLSTSAFDQLSTVFGASIVAFAQSAWLGPFIDPQAGNGPSRASCVDFSFNYAHRLAPMTTPSRLVHRLQTRLTQ